jgi:anti-sigma regulatory factor (Ser/Thr protein kinase)
VARHDATSTCVPAVLLCESDTACAAARSDPRGGASSALAGRLEVEAAAGPHAPAVARAAVERWLSGRVFETLFGGVWLLVSELVSNSVRDAQLTRDVTIRVNVAMGDGVVRIGVKDPGDGVIAAVAPDREHGGGLGVPGGDPRRALGLQARRRYVYGPSSRVSPAP